MMEKNCNLKILGQLFQVLYCQVQVPEKLLKTDNSLFYLRQNHLNLDVFNYRVFVCDKKVLCFKISTD